ncbi:unnamed protein product, partial [Nezara viridula]
MDKVIRFKSFSRCLYLTYWISPSKETRMLDW